MTSEGHGEARRLTPEGARGSLRPGICSPNCASHRGFGTFEGIVCQDIRHWRMIYGCVYRGPRCNDASLSNELRGYGRGQDGLSQHVGINATSRSIWGRT